MPGDGGGVSVPLSLFSGLVTELSVPDLPEGLSPDNQDVVFLPGSVASRPGLHAVYSTPLAGNVTVVYQKTYVQPNGNPLTLILDSAGNLWKEDVSNSPGTLTLIGTVPTGSYAQSCSVFGREYIAISDGVHGSGVPLQYDGTFLDRVTQDGPGAAPSVSNIAPPTATLSNSGTGAVTAITSITPSDPVTHSYQVPVYTPNPGAPPTVSYKTVTVTVYTTLTVVTAAPSGLAAGQLVSFSGVTPSSFDLNNVTISSVVNSTTFKVSYSTSSTATGAGGNVTLQNPSLSRLNNVVTANASAAHGFQPGWQVQIAGFANTALASISAISRDGNGIVTVTTSTPHGLPALANIAISGVTNPDASYNGNFAVASVPSPTTLTYSQVGTVTSGTGATGSVQDIWNGTFFVQSVPSPTTFTYQQLGANDLSNGTGTATVIGQISPGNHSCVLMFLTRQGYLTAPSQPVQFQANGSQQAVVTNIPIGPPNVISRVLAFTGAGGDNYFTLLATPLVNGQIVGSALIINDNTSTSTTVDFADNTLFGGTGIDIPGRNQFAQVVLAPTAGFFGYASRLFTWGELNKLQNFLNMGLDGGYLPSSVFEPPGSAINSGAGTPWTNPTNIEFTTPYADVSLAASALSQQLQTGNFGFPTISGSPQTVQGTFQFYWTGTPGLVLPIITVQLLKAGVAFGPTQQIFLSAFNQASSGAPNQASLTFSSPALSAADVNNVGFGFQIMASGGSNGAHVFVRNAGITVVSIPPVPLGWTNADSTSATGTLIPTTIAGFAYQMTSAGGLFDCLIEQPASQDINGIAILSPTQSYIARLNVTAQSGIVGGNLVIDFFSATQGSLAHASFPAASLPTSSKFVQATFSLQTPTVIPADTMLRVYLQSVDAGKVVTIDELEIAPATRPYRDNLLRGSYVNGPEQFDGVTGDIGPASDTSQLRCTFELRGFMYMHTAVGLHETVDNSNGEPSTWSIREISQSCGALSIKATDPGKLGSGDSGEQWEFTAARSGLYIYWGGETVKISQEIQTIWDSINFSAAQTIFVKNDPVSRRCYVGVPINGATAPNVLLVLDYRELNTPDAIAGTAPFRQSYSGRMIASEICRKWTKWNVQSNSAEIVTRPGRVEQLTVGAGNGQTPGAASGFGNLYYFDPAKLTDDDYGQIVPYWTTYFFVSNDQEQALQLDSHRKLATYFSAFLTGVGQTSITPLSDTLANAYPVLSDFPVCASQSHDLEWNINVDGERIAMKIGSIPAQGQTDNSFNLQKLVLTLKKHPWSAVRGTI